MGHRGLDKEMTDLGSNTASNFLAWKNGEKPSPPKREKTPDADKDPELLRKGFVRYFGYANEIGEAFKPLTPKWCYDASYAAAAAYVCADAIWRGTTASSGKMTNGPITEAADTLVWQGLASVAIPGFVINRVVWCAEKVAPLGSRIPTLVGLCAIPVIVEPIDHGVHWLLDRTIRPYYPRERWVPPRNDSSAK